jgi:hypothetical protein
VIITAGKVINTSQRMCVRFDEKSSSQPSAVSFQQNLAC